MNVERYILEALQKAVTTAVGSSPAVKYVGRNLTPPSNGKWWEIVYFPNNYEGEGWGEEKTYRGVLRLLLHWPMNNSGAYSAMDEVKRVGDYFNKGLLLKDPSNNVTVKISDNPNISSVIEEPPELLIPLTIRYTCFKV